MKQIKPILSLTENAINHVKKTLAEEKGAIGFRLSVTETGCSGLTYVPDVVTQEQEGDVVFEYKNINIYIPENCITMFTDLEIDYVHKDLGQTQMLFKNPNSQGDCGCGESFMYEVSAK